MRRVFLSLFAVAALSLTACKGGEKENEADTAEVEEQVEEEVTVELADATFGVRGNCKMCKKNIEKAALGVDGVSEASWDLERKEIALSYNPEEANLDAVHEAIAAVGYDTDKVEAADEVYSEVMKCCRYDRQQKMSLTEEEAAEAAEKAEEEGDGHDDH